MCLSISPVARSTCSPCGRACRPPPRVSRTGRHPSGSSCGDDWCYVVWAGWRRCGRSGRSSSKPASMSEDEDCGGCADAGVSPVEVALLADVRWRSDRGRKGGSAARCGVDRIGRAFVGECELSGVGDAASVGGPSIGECRLRVGDGVSFERVRRRIDGCNAAPVGVCGCIAFERVWRRMLAGAGARECDSRCRESGENGCNYERLQQL